MGRRYVSAVKVWGVFVLAGVLSASCGDSGSEASLHAAPNDERDGGDDSAKSAPEMYRAAI